MNIFHDPRSKWGWPFDAKWPVFGAVRGDLALSRRVGDQGAGRWKDIVKAAAGHRRGREGLHLRQERVFPACIQDDQSELLGERD